MRRLGRNLIRTLNEGKNTWDLYKKEPFFKRVMRVLYTSDILEPIFNLYYSICGFFQNIERLIEYAPLVWEHRNWDYGFVLRFQKKLYEDLYNGVYKKGHHIFSKQEARRLETVVNLIGRLSEDNYDDWHYDYLEKKYGKNEILFEKIPGTENKAGGPYSRMTSSREKRMTKEENLRYTTDQKRLWKLEELQKKQDMELLNKLIAKYHRKWWN